MPARSIASLTLSFGLVSIPVRLYSAAESEATIRFNLLAPDGSRVKQQYISESSGEKVERSQMKKGYEFEKGHYVVFEPDELKALEESPNHIVDILAFIPEKAVDPVYYNKAYYLAPDKRGAKPYGLLRQALLESEKSALASWASKGKTYMVQIRPTEEGLVFHQLYWADEVRSMSDLNIENVPASQQELQLALKIIEQGEAESYDPTQYENTEKKRVLAAIDEKIRGKQIVAPPEAEAPTGGQVIDLMEALRASLAAKGGKAAATTKRTKAVEEAEPQPAKPRRAVKRAASEPAPAKVRARK